MQGILYALVPMLAWGSLGLVSNKIGGNANQQTFGVTLGGFAFSLLVYLVIRPELTMSYWTFGIIGGLLWALGQNGQFKAMQLMGVSIASPLSAGSQLVIGSLIGAFVFGEWTTSIQFLLGGFAVLSLLTGFYFSSKTDPGRGGEPVQARDKRYGVFALAYSTFGYLSYTILFNNIMRFDALSVLLPMSIGMVIGASGLMRFQVSFEPVVLKNAIGGLLWGLGTVFMLLAAEASGLAIAVSFAQMSGLVGILGGIFILGEQKTPKERLWVSIGIVCFLLGAVLLAVVKAY